MGEAFEAAITAAQERIEETFRNWRAVSRVDPDAEEAEVARVAYVEAIDAANDLLRRPAKA